MCTPQLPPLSHVRIFDRSPNRFICGWQNNKHPSTPKIPHNAVSLLIIWFVYSVQSVHLNRLSPHININTVWVWFEHHTWPACFLFFLRWGQRVYVYYCYTSFAIISVFWPQLCGAANFVFFLSAYLPFSSTSLFPDPLREGKEHRQGPRYIWNTRRAFNIDVSERIRDSNF